MKIKQFLILSFFLFSIACKKNSNAVINTDWEQLSIDSTIPKNEKIIKIITPYKSHLNNQLDSILCYNPKYLTRTDGPLESSLGNLMADICFKKGNKVLKNQINKKADFILLNYGGIRAPIPKGNITLKNAYKVMPFENELVLVKLSGLKVKELLTYLFKSKNAHPTSNISLKLNNTSYQDVIINNRKFNENKNYYILTSNYLQQGGDKMNFFKSPILLYNTKYKIRTALIDYFKETDTLKTELDNRFSYAK
jgi:5'-nucleotidase